MARRARGASKFGRECPKKLSVVGYDDQEGRATPIPPLTTVVLPNYEMGRSAVQTLLAEAAPPDGSARGVRQPRWNARCWYAKR